MSDRAGIQKQVFNVQSRAPSKTSKTASPSKSRSVLKSLNAVLGSRSRKGSGQGGPGWGWAVSSARPSGPGRDGKSGGLRSVEFEKSLKAIPQGGSKQAKGQRRVVSLHQVWPHSAPDCKATLRCQLYEQGCPRGLSWGKEDCPSPPGHVQLIRQPPLGLDK